MTKNIVYSKTMWVNILTMVALLLQFRYGFVISPEEQAAILAVINMLLRLITQEKLSLK